MEAASEPPRGRPLTFTDDERAAFVAAACPQVHSRRGQADHLFADRARRVLARPDGTADAAFGWLTGNAGRHGLLAQLGRFDDDDLVRQHAASLCRKRPRVKAGITSLKRLRLGNTNSARVNPLAAAIRRAIDAYGQVHPGLTHRKTLSALFKVRQKVAEADRLDRRERWLRQQRPTAGQTAGARGGIWDATAARK